MKKLLSIFALSLILFTCSSSDNGDEQNPCSKPRSLSVDTITNTTAKLGWYAQDTSSLFEVQYGPLGFSLGSGIIETIPNSYVYVYDLMPSTQYSFYARVFCQSTNSFSDWAGPYAFVTTENNNFCNDPSQLELNPWGDGGPVGQNHVNLIWEDPESAGGEVQYGLEGFNLGTGTFQLENDNSYDRLALIENLSPNTSYDFYVRNNCLGEGISNWIGPLTVTTTDIPFNVNCLDPINFTLDQIYTSGGSDILVFSWSPQNGENTWQIHRNENGQPFNSGTTLDTSYNPIQLTNYTIQGEIYHFYVRANCGIDGYSDWIGPITLTGP